MDESKGLPPSPYNIHITSDAMRRQVAGSQRRNREIISEFLDYAERDGRHDVSNLRQNIDSFVRLQWANFYIPPEEL